MCPTEKGRGEHFQHFEPASRCAVFPTLSGTATSWNINKAQGETSPAIIIKKSTKLCLSPQKNDYAHFDMSIFTPGGPHPFQTVLCPVHPGASAQHILTCSSCSKREEGGRWCLIAQEEGLKSRGSNSTFKQGISIPGCC